MRRFRAGSECGSATAELVLLAPVILAFMLTAVGFGRVAKADAEIGDAARAGAATAAVQGYAAAARFGALEAIGSTLSADHVSCAGTPQVTIDTSTFAPGGSVSVTITCTVDLSAVALPGLPGSRTMTASATAPVDPYVSITS